MSAKVIAKNRKAFHNYEILDRYEAGVVLLGTEVKAISDHKVNLNNSYAQIQSGEVWIQNCHIGSYSHAGSTTHDPTRPRKLLLHRREINKLVGKISRKGFTLVPLRLYFKDGKVKVEVALARGKQLYDKREAAKRKEVDKEIKMGMRQR